MPLVIPIGFTEIALQFRNSGDPQPWYVTFGVDSSEVGGDYTAMADTIAEAWGGTAMPIMRTTTRLTGVQMRIGQDGGDPLTVFAAQDISGDSTSNKLPQNCALLVTKVTERSGRTGKGRIFVPNILSEGDVDDVGVIAGGTVTEFQDIFDDFNQALSDPPSGPSFPAVLLHNSGVPGGTTPSPITRWAVNGVIATQRRRLR
jgi:hypothetical protein